MADLDAELLALAGGDSSGEEESLPSPTRPKSSSPPPSRSAKESAADMGRKGIAKPVSKGRKRPAAKRRARSNDEDDDEV
jgi:RNA polymerase-associated protein RTF1